MSYNEYEEKIPQKLSWYESQVRFRQHEYDIAKERVIRALDLGLLLDAKNLIDLELLPAQNRLALAETDLMMAKLRETKKQVIEG